MAPGVGRQRKRCVDLLFGTVAVGGDGKTQVATARHGGQEKIARGAGAEIKDALPSRATVPFYPGRDGAAIGHRVGQQHIIADPVEVQHVAPPRVVGDESAAFQRAIV